MEYVFTSEFVGRGHPDKVADQISDSIVDYIVAREPEARVASEVLVTTNNVVLAGETKTKFPINNDEIDETVRRTIRNIGYDGHESFHWEFVRIQNFMHEQSSDIAQGVDSSTVKEEGAGDQGIMFGFANDETPCYMPMAIYYAGLLTRQMEKDIAIQHLPLGPDMKCQVTLRYRDDHAISVDNLLVSIQHSADTTQQTINDFIHETAQKVFPAHLPINRIIVNPTGRFVIGGPNGDTGLTGRKIIVDTYGGYAPHGGGAFSGKDPTKVDRSASYVARYLAKNILAAKLAKKCLIQLSYAIGMPKPLSVYVFTEGTGEIPDNQMADAIEKNIDLSPQSIRNILQLNKPIYEVTSYGGHFGRDPYEDFFPWEKLDLVNNIKNWI